MEFAVRRIKKGRWYALKDTPNEVPATALRDLVEGMSDDTMSWWRIEADASNWRRVMAAIAAERDSVEQLDYSIVPLNDLAMHGRLESKAGKSPDDIANRYHLDLTQMTARSVVGLAEVIHGRPRIRMHEDEIGKLIDEQIANGSLDVARIKPNLIGSLERNRRKWTR